MERDKTQKQENPNTIVRGLKMSKTQHARPLRSPALLLQRRRNGVGELVHLHQEYDIPPTRKEIMEAVNIRSSDAIEYAIKRLEEDGKVKRSLGRARNLFVIS